MENEIRHIWQACAYDGTVVEIKTDKPFITCNRDGSLWDGKILAIQIYTPEEYDALVEKTLKKIQEEHDRTT